jgi:hypothetical protein
MSSLGDVMAQLAAYSIRFVLDDLDFPAERWEIVTAAEHYGADAATCEWLRRLPLRAVPYQNIQEVIDALDEPIPLPRAGRSRRL